MENLWFVFKAMVLTVACIMLLQVKASENVTLEMMTVQWLQTNAAVDVLRGVADGAVKGIKQMYRGSMKVLDHTVGQALGPHEEQAGNRKAAFTLKRSEAVQAAEEEKREAQQKAESLQ